ncbi:alpha/beta fold hydrolase [Cohnella hashimotonis]|uniref:Alpha/beta hydrolase n=1 Tax=Cohnella hashimotonis TaxID=2826895 RepID=A0ABT6TA50_9BACL|nr:alpha/beta hydrolase [Cohnella hashimotonis]MDI4643706.1 alpha/beta hydrolase [Cohnella hashimotonis]
MKTKSAFKSQKGQGAILQFYDAMIERWPVPHEKINIETRLGNTHIIASGDVKAPPLILLHGSAMNAAMWIGDTAAYSRSYRVYAVDIPGEPGRSAEQQYPLNGPAYAEWLFDLFQGLGIEKASLIGISFGAWMALKFSVSYPDRVDKLVLISPSGVGPQKLSFLFRALPLLFLGDKGKNRLIRMVNGDQPVSEKMMQYQKLIGENFNRRGKIPLFADDELKRLTMPASLFVGQKDIMLHAAKSAERLRHLLPHADVHVDPKAGHTLIQLTDKILSFLAKDTVLAVHFKKR